MILRSGQHLGAFDHSAYHRLSTVEHDRRILMGVHSVPRDRLHVTKRAFTASDESIIY